jgi:hypothetical protein
MPITPILIAKPLFGLNKFMKLNFMTSSTGLKKRVTFLSCALFCLVFGTQAMAGNTSGVHGPNVDPDDRSMQVRAALAPADNAAQQDQWAYRYHYQHSFNDKFRARIVAQYRDRGDFEYDFLRAEFLYNFKKAIDSNWSSGIRFDVRTRRGSRAEEIALHWTNQWNLDNGYRLRAIVLGNLQVGGSRSSNDLGIATRAGLSKKLDNGIRVGAEMFNSYGRLGNFGSFNEQSHQFGPTVAGSIGGFKYQLRWLKGLSNGSRDDNFEIRFDKAF